MLLNGSGDEEIEFRYTDARGSAQRRRHAFEGILPNLERRYRETESAAVREELGKYRGTRPCPECGGTRLNAAARAVLRRRPQHRRDHATDRRPGRGSTSASCSSPAGAARWPRASCAKSATGCASWSTSASTT